jgi:hypothetical protein
MTRWFAVRVAAAVTLALVLAGCGGGSGPSASSPPSVPSASGTWHVLRLVPTSICIGAGCPTPVTFREERSRPVFNADGTVSWPDVDPGTKCFMRPQPGVGILPATTCKGSWSQSGTTVTFDFDEGYVKFTGTISMDGQQLTGEETAWRGLPINQCPDYATTKLCGYDDVNKNALLTRTPR